jgi:hypothetical protein
MATGDIIPQKLNAAGASERRNNLPATVRLPSLHGKKLPAMALGACAGVFLAACAGAFFAAFSGVFFAAFSVQALAQAEASAQVPAGADLQACRDACQALGSRLMQAMQASLKEGGTTAAIAICRDKAPAIAAEVSLEKGCTVRRTSLKTRNPKNSPDIWERRVLESFQKLSADGKDPASLEFSEVVREEGVLVLRYMKGIAVGGPCLACHGRSLEPGVSAAIGGAYPEDSARDYGKGDLRGAFSVRKPLPSAP